LVFLLLLMNIRFRFKLGSEPLGPDAPRPYRQALCAPYHIKGALQLC
jgi:hypothetical protein